MLALCLLPLWGSGQTFRSKPLTNYREQNNSQEIPAAAKQSKQQTPFAANFHSASRNPRRGASCELWPCPQPTQSPLACTPPAPSPSHRLPPPQLLDQGEPLSCQQPSPSPRTTSTYVQKFQTEEGAVAGSDSRDPPSKVQSPPTPHHPCRPLGSAQHRPELVSTPHKGAERSGLRSCTWWPDTAKGRRTLGGPSVLSCRPVVDH